MCKKVWLIVLVLAGLMVPTIGLFLHSRNLQHNLANYQQELRLRGEKLSLEEIAPKLPPEAIASGSNLVLTCLSLKEFAFELIGLPDSVIMQSNYHAPCISAIPSLDALKTNKFETGSKSPPAWSALEKGVQDHAAVMSTIAELATSTNLQTPIDLQTIPLPRTNGNAILRAIRCFQGAVFHHLHRRESLDAHRYAVAQLRLLRCVQAQPLIDTSLAHCHSRVFVTSWELLNQARLSEEQLFELQKEWELLDPYRAAERAFEVERTFLPHMREYCRRHWNEWPYECLCDSKHYEEFPGYWIWLCSGIYRAEKESLADAQDWINALRKNSCWKPGCFVAPRSSPC